MKLLVCDVEGTIFEPHIIKDAEHASYIWTKIADELGESARAEEIRTQKKWREGGYGASDSGTAYIGWVRATIRIHQKYRLSTEKFSHIIKSAPYVPGVETFFAKLNRAEFIPVLISGGIQNLNSKACIDLHIKRDNSFAACEYYFNQDGNIDWDLTFVNSCNFFGKEEIVDILLRKYGLGRNDWIFIGDGVNDKSIAEKAAISIGIKPVGGLEDVVDYSFSDFNDLLACDDLIVKTKLLSDECDSPNKTINSNAPNDSLTEYTAEIEKRTKKVVNNRIENLHLEELKIRALNRICRASYNETAIQNIKKKLNGVRELLEAGQLTYVLHSELLKKKHITSSLLQTYTNAAEVMMLITFILMASNEKLQQFIQSHSEHEDFKSVYYWIESIENTSLKMILRDYKNMRNLAAHTYQLISITAAQSFILRTYENIQRLELIINPIKK